MVIGHRLLVVLIYLILRKVYIKSNDSNNKYLILIYDPKAKIQNLPPIYKIFLRNYNL